MPREKTAADALHGTLDLLVLSALALAPMHGWGISQRLGELSEGRLEVNQGSLYPALQRLEQRGWVRSDWRRTENNRRARYYRLTDTGREMMGREEARWRRHVEAVSMVLGAV
jgi:PadR family transcriptional regulator PadR